MYLVLQVMPLGDHSHTTDRSNQFCHDLSIVTFRLHKNETLRVSLQRCEVYANRSFRSFDPAGRTTRIPIQN